MNSTDLGVTWSSPREITTELDLNLSGSTDPLVLEYGTGPGNGIQLASGRLVIPSYYFDQRGCHLIYSDDHGTTWQKGDNLNRGSECQVFEAVNGSLCLNARPRPPGNYRIVAWSHDGGETWASWYSDKELSDPRCMASIIRFTDTPTHLRNRVLFSNPAKMSRGHLTMRMSYDEGATWNVSKLVYEGPSAYSQLAILANYTICLLFEQGLLDYRESIQFVRIDLDWLTDSLDFLSPI
jgi:sialidase-1